MCNNNINVMCVNIINENVIILLILIIIMYV